MFQIRKKILDYYSNVINQIDIKAETLLLNKELNQNQIDEINSTRQDFLDEIKKIQDFNLQNAEKNANLALKEEEEKCGYRKFMHDTKSYLFKDKFCLFLENKLEYAYCFDERDSIGKLIILPNYLTLNPNPPLNQYDNSKMIQNEEMVYPNIEGLSPINIDKIGKYRFLNNDIVKICILLELVKMKGSKRNSIIDLSNLELNNLEKLTLTSINIVHLEQGSFYDLDKIINIKLLKRLEIFIYQIKFFIENPFSDLKYLEYLRCESVSLVLVQDSFKGLENLKVLDLSECHLIDIDNDAFSNLPSLEKLSLANCLIKKKLNTEIFTHLAHLKELDLSSIFLEEISYGYFRSLSELKILNLEGNRLNRINKDAFIGLEKLQVLNVKGNLYLLEVWRNTFKHFKELKILNFCDIKWEKFYEFVFDYLDNLIIFDCSYNYFKNIEICFYEKIKNIKLLNFRSCRLEEIQVKLGLNRLSKLEVLDLSGNENLKIDFENLNLPNLKYFAYDSNKIENFQKHILEALVVNNLDSFEKDSLKSFPKLRYLSLHFDQEFTLKELDQEYFSNQYDLAWIEFDISNLEQDFLKFLKNYENLFCAIVKRGATDLYEPKIMASETMGVEVLDPERIIGEKKNLSINADLVYYFETDFSNYYD